MQIAQLSALDELLHPDDGWAIDEGVASEKNAFLGCCQGYQLVRKLSGVCQRFFDENMLACQQRPPRQPVMSGDGRSDDHRVQVACQELVTVEISLHRRMLLFHPFETLRTQVTNGGEIASGELAQNPGQVRTPISHADEPYLDHDLTPSGTAGCASRALRAFDSTIPSRSCERY